MIWICPSLMGSVVSSLAGSGRSPDRKRILAYFVGHRTHFLHLHVYADALSSSNSILCHIWVVKADVWGYCPPLVPT